ncbi:hypothetical protein LAZ67_20000967 [Cordylochernes scorpioides]|uniref:Uncharacterized protein n=1 Tax=Cordylochernes scorpioides TaxID=51811 RepID=A0ABY6LJM5_9ARAC|nr:hypothetical protein LAZ67_20000967 [Cordylochernes scorpioides]
MTVLEKSTPVYNSCKEVEDRSYAVDSKQMLLSQEVGLLLTADAGLEVPEKDHVIKVVAKIMIFIKSNGLNNRLFQEFLSSFNLSLHDLENDSLAILESAKTRIYRHFLGLEIRGVQEDPLLVWRRTLSRWWSLPSS